MNDGNEKQIKLKLELTETTIYRFHDLPCELNRACILKNQDLEFKCYLS